MPQTKAPSLGRFELRSELGRGYHGRVYLAWDPQLERKVAIKLLLGAQRDEANHDKFLVEARAVARLSHPNIIPLYEVGVYGKTPFLVFEFVEGVPLKQEMQKRGALPERDAAKLFMQALEGMSVAHAQDVAHLDLSPNNLMFDRNQRVRVMDFGLARFASAPEPGDGEERTHGTPRYMSPEHYRGGKLDRRTDVFALGLIFFELLAGEPAALGDGLSVVRRTILAGAFDWEKLRRLGVSSAVVQVLRDALAIEPDARFQTAGEFAQALGEAIASQSQPASHDIAIQFLLRRLQRRPEFPAFSSSILEINRMTSEDSSANLRDLADVIQRDFSLSNRLMKIANSAFFDRGGGGVSTIVQALNMVGTRLIRLLCNGLLVFEKLQNGQEELQDALVSCFVAALMARNLGLTYRRDLAEEAFVCGLFNRLGRNLVIYYLPEEWSEIRTLQSAGIGSMQSEERVLGTRCAAVGAAVARSWKFPASIVDSMAPVLSEPAISELERPMHLRLIAQMANELCEAAYGGQESPLEEADGVAFRYRNTLHLSPVALGELLEGALGSFLELAPSLGINAEKSHFCLRATEFVQGLRVAGLAQDEHVPD